MAWRAGPAAISAANLIEDFELSPKGERVLFAARGDIFTAPVEKGPPRNLTNSSGAHDKWPRWSPDGSKIAYISDRTGEEEIWVVAQDGSSAPRATHHRRQGHALRAGMVGGRQAHRLQRQGRRAVLADRGG